MNELVGLRFKYDSKYGISKWTHKITETMIVYSKKRNSTGATPILYVKGHGSWYEANSVLIV